MNIASLSINRPVLSSVLSIAILLFGIVSFSMLGLREYPSVDPPIVSVSTSYTGANSEIIETQITEPLEEQINGVAGIRSITSVSAEGRSRITVEFNLGVDIEAATNDVRDRVSKAQRNLPPDCDPPLVMKADADADAIIILAVQSDTKSLLELTDIATNIFKERLQTIPGVSGINVFGEKKYSMKLMLDPQKLAAYHLNPSDISDALNRENVELPSGRIEGDQTELSIRTMGRLRTEEDFNNLIIKEQNASVIRLKDIGEARLLPENERQLMRGNGVIPQVAVAISPQPGANHIAIADEFNKRLVNIQKEIPADIQASVILDTTKSIRKSIKEVEETIFISFALVVLIIFLFLRHWRTTLIPVLAIPISLIGTFFVMYISGFSINLLTLLGIVLATGLVVDDAIVVLENIFSKIEKGIDPVEAGHSGSKEILFAIISTTITLAAVFLPIIFLQGMTGRLFREFAIVVAGAVLISAFISLTLTPMMSARMLRKSHNQSKIFLASERFFDAMSRKYRYSLEKFVARRRMALFIIGGSLVLIFVIGSLIPSELIPVEDKGQLRITSTAPEGTSFEAMDTYFQNLAEIVDTLPEKVAFIANTSFSSQGVNTGFMRISLCPANQRERSQQEISDDLNKIFKKNTFARTFASQEQTISTTRGGLPVQFVIQAPNFEKLKEAIPAFLDKAQASKQFQVVDINLKFNKPELNIEIDRVKAQSMGFSVRDIAEVLELYFSGQRYGYFIKNEKQYQVIGQALRKNRNDPSDLQSITLTNKQGKQVMLGDMIKVTESSRPPQLYRYNRFVSATISAETVKGVTLGQGIAEMRRIAGEVLNDDYATALSGASRDFEESSSNLVYALLFTLILIYLVLAAQFESYRDPLIIMFTVPLAITGAVISWYIFGQTINLFSEIGIIVLIGIVTKNGILIVEFANQRKLAGLNLGEAVIDAAAQRLRPILMTSLATMLGALPIALALGAASKSRIPMGITIIGGLLFSLILTLYVVPAMYTYLSKEKKYV